jgi:hypothetical protein
MDSLAREIIEGARKAHDPTPEDRARVHAKLLARIGVRATVRPDASRSERCARRPRDGRDSDR